MGLVVVYAQGVKAGDLVDGLERFLGDVVGDASEIVGEREEPAALGRAVEI